MARLSGQLAKRESQYFYVSLELLSMLLSCSYSVVSSPSLIPLLENIELLCKLDWENSSTCFIVLGLCCGKIKHRSAAHGEARTLDLGLIRTTL